MKDSLKTETHYIASILRGLRDKIIAALTVIKFTLGNNYKLSGINELSTKVTLTLTGRSLTVQSVGLQTSQIKKALTEKFGCEIPIESSGNLKEILKIDLVNAYNLQPGATSIPQENDKKADDALPKPDDRKMRTEEGQIMKIKDLEKLIVEIMTDNTKLAKGDLAAGYVILPRAAGVKEITLSFKSKFTFDIALSVLETGFAKYIQVTETGGIWRFTIHLEEVTVNSAEQKRRDDAYNFIINFKKMMNTIGPRAVVKTPTLWIASAKNKLQNKTIEVQMPGPGEAAYAQHYLDEHFESKKEGAILTIMVPPDLIEKYSKEEITFKAKIKSRKGLMAIAQKIADATKDLVTGYIRMSTKYEEFYFLDFNRDTVASHVIKLVESIKMFGYLQFIIVIETDIIDGKMKKWIVDGQHRFKGCKAEGMPILYTTVEGITSMYELVRLIAKLNTTSRSWNLVNFVEAWAKSLKIPEYQNLRKRQKETELPLTLLIEMYTSQNRKQSVPLMMDGKFDVVNKNAEQEIDWVASIQKAFFGKSRDLCAGLYTCIKQIGKAYDNDRMKKALRNAKNKYPFIMGDKRDEVALKFLEMYKKAA